MLLIALNSVTVGTKGKPDVFLLSSCAQSCTSNSLHIMPLVLVTAFRRIITLLISISKPYNSE